MPKQFWDVPAIKEYLRGEFGLVYESDRSYHYLLKFQGLSFKLPLAFDFKRDKDQINLRLKEIHQELPKYLNNNDWEVLTADEARITWEAEIRRAWLKKNEKTVVKVHRSNQYQNYFGALNLKSKEAHTIRLDWQETDEIIRALEELLKSYPEEILSRPGPSCEIEAGNEIASQDHQFLFIQHHPEYPTGKCWIHLYR